MGEPIETEYFNWLCAKVLNRGVKSYYSLLEILYQTEFVWVVSADRHRVEDGLELRQDFFRETFTKRDSIFENEPCSVFELLVSFANRASFQTSAPVRDWFWVFMANLQLDQFRSVSDLDRSTIEQILHTFIWRTYDPNGIGGLFPLSITHNDQRKVEIWYQFYEYLDDQGL